MDEKLGRTLPPRNAGATHVVVEKQRYVTFTYPHTSGGDAVRAAALMSTWATPQIMSVEEYLREYDPADHYITENDITLTRAGKSMTLPVDTSEYVSDEEMHNFLNEIEDIWVPTLPELAEWLKKGGF